MKFAGKFLIFLLAIFIGNVIMFSSNEEWYEWRFFTIDSCILGNECDREYELSKNKKLTNYLSTYINYEFENVTVEVIDDYYLCIYFHTNTDLSSDEYDTFKNMHEDLTYYLNEYYRGLSGRFVRHLEDRDIEISTYVLFNNGIRLEKFSGGSYVHLLIPTKESDVSKLVEEYSEELNHIYSSIDFWMITDFYFYEDKRYLESDTNTYYGGSHYKWADREMDFSLENNVLYIDLEGFRDYSEFDEYELIRTVYDEFENFTIDLDID